MKLIRYYISVNVFVSILGGCSIDFRLNEGKYFENDGHIRRIDY